MYLFGYNDKSKAYQLMTTNKISRCKARAFIHKEMRWKLDTHSIYCIFLGYNDKSKAYRLMTTNGPQILTSRHIIFYETHMKSTYNFIQQDDEFFFKSLLDANLF